MTLYIGRIRKGMAVESQRVAHLFNAPGESDTVITALCGATFGSGMLELLPGIQGMPCEGCLAAVEHRGTVEQ